MTEVDRLAITTPGEVRGDLLVIALCEGQEPPVEGLPEPLAEAARSLARRRGWRAGEKQWLETSPEAEGGTELPVVALAGLGKTEDLTPRDLHLRLLRLVEQAQHERVDELTVLPAPLAVTRGEAAAERILSSLYLAQYRYDRYLTESDRKRHRVARVSVVPPVGEEAVYTAAAEVCRGILDGVVLARDLANTPGNEAHPGWMEEQARQLAASRDVKIEVLQQAELEELGMGGLLAVGAGSQHPPRLVCLEVGEGPLSVSLVGKGVTFDTGGISLKPSAKMEEMKYDKSGACAVLGITQAVADLQLPVRLRSYVALAENMPDGAAYRPGDVVRCFNGKTVEILNTDAEGRMILADALAWACREKPDVLVEYSTLTGASVVALGEGAGALYTPDDQLAADLLAAAEGSGERLWRMPLWPEFVEQMKGHHADLKNSGGRWGGANTAAAFLSQFIDGVERWAHLDIAGGASVGSEGDEPRGATGYGVPLTLRWLRRQVA